MKSRNNNNDARISETVMIHKEWNEQKQKTKRKQNKSITKTEKKVSITKTEKVEST